MKALYEYIRKNLPKNGQPYPPGGSGTSEYSLSLDTAVPGHKMVLPRLVVVSRMVVAAVSKSTRTFAG